MPHGDEGAQHAHAVAQRAAKLDGEIDIVEPGQFRMIVVVAIRDDAEGGGEGESRFRLAADGAEKRKAQEMQLDHRPGLHRVVVGALIGRAAPCRRRRTPGRGLRRSRQRPSPPSAAAPRRGRQGPWSARWREKGAPASAPDSVRRWSGSRFTAARKSP